MNSPRQILPGLFFGDDSRQEIRDETEGLTTKVKPTPDGALRQAPLWSLGSFLLPCCIEATAP